MERQRQLSYRQQTAAQPVKRDNTMKKYTALFILAFLSINCHAATNCANLIEVQCDSNKCETSESFTPMSIAFDKKNLEVCAYSGCWKGAYTKKIDGKISLLVARKMKWNGVSPNPADAVLTLYGKDNLGQLKVGNFFVPIRCEVSVATSPAS